MAIETLRDIASASAELATMASLIGHTDIAIWMLEAAKLASTRSEELLG
jgi:hypothetical protein